MVVCIKQLKLLGIYMLLELKRFMLVGSVVCSIVGIIDFDGKGTVGVEVQFDLIFMGIKGLIVREWGRDGYMIVIGY